MLSIGQLIGRSAGVLWRRRWIVLGLTVAWLMSDGLALRYGSDFLPRLELPEPPDLLDHPFDLTWHLHAAVVFTLLTLPQELLRDFLRAVFAVLILRTLLVSSPERGRPRFHGIAVSMALILLFEMAWTALLVSMEKTIGSVASWAWTEVIYAAELLPPVMALVPALIFAGYSLAMSRLCFVYAHATLGRQLGLRRSWRETRGLAVRLVVLFVTIPISLHVLHSTLLNPIIRFESLRQAIPDPWPSILLSQSIHIIPASVLGLVVVAVAYASATGHPTAVIPGAMRTSHQLAKTFD